MSRKDNFIKSKANYTLTNKHQTTNRGTIYSQDYMTIQPMDGLFNNDEITYSDSNFKFRVRKDANAKKKHNRGNWASWQNDSDSGIVWTIGTIDNTITNETKISLKPNYNSLSDFACYGSALELVHASINDIIARFPGAIMLTNDVAIANDVPIMYNGKYIQETFYKVSNETGIDIDTMINIDKSLIKYPYRYLYLSTDKYSDKNGNPITSDKYTLSYQLNDYSICGDNSIVAIVNLCGYELWVYYNNGKKYLLSKKSGNDIIITPNKSLRDEFFDSLDDFEKVLLDRDSQPIYRSEFETPYSTDEGERYRMESYVFPTKSDNYTPDLTSSAYNMYLERLIDLAAYHDNYDADNIWRCMTHEAIKNLDYTFIRETTDTTEDLSNIDSSRIKMIAELYGREYDDLLRNANNIKQSNTITYDEKNNIPDYFLNDKLEESGWEIINTNPTTDNTLRSRVIYSGSSSIGYTGSDTNLNFLRRLKLNSAYINTLKGTRQGIKTILGLFGLYENKDYSIEEKVAIAKPKEGENSYPSYSDVIYWNSLKDNMEGSQIEQNDLKGIPAAGVTSSNGNSYIIPWFNKNEEYDGNIYFQMKGGWKKKSNLKINLGITSLSSITSNTLYGETIPYLKFADSINDMLAFSADSIKDGDICYVTNIQDAYDNYVFGESDNPQNFDFFSHYFILENLDYSTFLGYVKDGCYGWRNIFQYEYDGSPYSSGQTTEAGSKVLYLESINATNKGNNPHGGYGNYDEGEEYLDYFRTLFKYSLENDNFSSADSDTIDKIKDCGFDVSYLTDNKKCHYFEDTFNEDNLIPIGEIDDDSLDNDEEYKSLFNPEGGKLYDEAAANSVINTKAFTLNFKLATGKDEEKEYIENIIIPFVEQMIPSTTIFSYNIGDSLIFPIDSISETMSALHADGVILSKNDKALYDNSVAVIQSGTSYYDTIDNGSGSQITHIETLKDGKNI